MTITKELLKQKFEEYNKLYFNNELPMCTFSYNYMRDAFGRYTTHTKNNGQKVGHIWISKRGTSCKVPGSCRGLPW